MKTLENRINIYTPRGIAAGSADMVQIVINHFMGSEQTKVEYRIKDLRGWQTMTKTLMFDPFYEKSYKRWKLFIKQKLLKKWKSDLDYANEPLPGTSLPLKDRSSHIWTANLNKDLHAGECVIEVRVKDGYNRTFQNHQLMTGE